MDYPTSVKQMEKHTLSATCRSTALSPFVYLAPANQPIELDTDLAADLLTYISVASPTAGRWSFPREIKEVKSKKTRIVKLSVPLAQPDAAMLCCKITAAEDAGVCQLLIETQDVPNVVFRNNCPYSLVFGECIRKGPGIDNHKRIEKEFFFSILKKKEL